jgi:hypothetical protein
MTSACCSSTKTTLPVLSNATWVHPEALPALTERVEPGIGVS